MWNLKKDANELISKQSHRCRKQTYAYQGVKGIGINWETGIDVCTLLYIE